MTFFKSQPSELDDSELFHTCTVCDQSMDLRLKQSTPFRGKWVHIACWKKLI